MVCERAQCSVRNAAAQFSGAMQRAQCSGAMQRAQCSGAIQRRNAAAQCSVRKSETCATGLFSLHSPGLGDQQFQI
jgi:hypothetical protein